MPRLLRFALCLALLAPLHAQGGLRFWTRSEGILTQTGENRFELQLPRSTPSFRLRLHETPDGTNVQVSDGQVTLAIGQTGPLVQPGSIGWFCIREHEGEHLEGDVSTSLPEALPGEPLQVPVGRAEVGDWVFWQVQWDIGGCGIAGLFSSQVIVAQHLPTGTWTARTGFGTGFCEWPLKQSSQPRFVHVPAQRTSNNCWVRVPWNFQVHRGKARVVTGPRTYQWFCGTTLADSPRHARLWGHQEVAWHVASSDPQGGKAQAFAASPRAASDFEGILPRPGVQAFQWRSLVVAAGMDGRRRFIDPWTAHDLARTGHWDVVLENRNGAAVATWLVEHDRDFPHSTPPKAPR